MGRCAHEWELTDDQITALCHGRLPPCPKCFPSWEREQTLRAAQNVVIDAANSHIVKLNERIATLEAEIVALKRHQSPHLPESGKPEQDAVWRNATRFSR